MQLARDLRGGLAGSAADTLVIAGGTGAYARATGSVEITEGRGRTGFQFVFGG
jgi:hypothetical protein